MKHYRVIVLLLGVLFISGCTPQWNTLSDTVSSAPSGSTQTNDTYAFAVDHSEGVGTTHTIDLTPHEQNVRFFANAQETTLRSYNYGTEPFIIRATQGDTVNIKVHNTLNQETSVHRHGVRVPNSQDGVPGVTQEPIQPGEVYTYSFPVHDAGTFFFHPHINTVEQMGRGLYGILIVEPTEYPFSFDTELVRALKDYRINQDGTLNENFSGLMDFTHGGRLGNIMTINNVVNPQITVEGGSTTLLRLINPSNARIYNLDFSEWDAKIVGTDGGFVAHPYDAGIVQLSPGERIELLVSVSDRALQLTDTYFPSKPYLLATLSPQSFKATTGPKIDTSLFPDIPDRTTLANQEPDEVVNLGGIGVMGGDRGMMGAGARGWTINNGIRPDSHSVLHWEIGKMRVVRIKNNTKRDHPMHLHGDFFQILGINGQKVPRVGWKDTMNVPAQGYIDLAILPTNPGTWMFHCHIIEHAHYGMMTTVVVQ